jgi:hypothetical protein
MVWNFIVLKGTDYCISEEYTAATDDIFSIFKMLKSLKSIIKTQLSLIHPIC